MPDHHMKNRQTLMIELQHYNIQGISILLEGDFDSSIEMPDVMQVREEISYMEKDPDLL